MSVRDNYTMINIREYLALGTDEEVGEPALVRLLSDFSCPKNPDVEYFYNKNFDYPEKPLKYKHIRRISD